MCSVGLQPVCRQSTSQPGPPRSPNPRSSGCISRASRGKIRPGIHVQVELIWGIIEMQIFSQRATTEPRNSSYYAEFFLGLQEKSLLKFLFKKKKKYSWPWLGVTISFHFTSEILVRTAAFSSVERHKKKDLEYSLGGPALSLGRGAKYVGERECPWERTGRDGVKRSWELLTSTCT